MTVFLPKELQSPLFHSIQTKHIPLEVRITPSKLLPPSSLRHYPYQPLRSHKAHQLFHLPEGRMQRVRHQITIESIRVSMGQVGPPRQSHRNRASALDHLSLLVAPRNDLDPGLTHLCREISLVVQVHSSDVVHPALSDPNFSVEVPTQHQKSLLLSHRVSANEQFARLPFPNQIDYHPYRPRLNQVLLTLDGNLKIGSQKVLSRCSSSISKIHRYPSPSF